MKNEQEANAAIAKYSDMVRRVCFMHLKNNSDVEDVFQDVFFKYILYDKPFASDEHEKAWLIRVTINACKDLLKSFFRQKVHTLDESSLSMQFIQNEQKEVLDAVLRLPEKYRDAIYLFFYEGYSAVEIARILHKPENTVYTWLARGKSQLRNALGGDWNG